MTFSQNFALALPEAILAASALVLLIYGAFSPRSTLAVNAGGALALVLAAAAAAFGKQGIAFHGAFVADNASAFAKVAIYLASAVALPMAGRWFE